MHTKQVAFHGSHLKPKPESLPTQPTQTANRARKAQIEPEAPGDTHIVRTKGDENGSD